jgi:hypothetical protein
MMSTTSEMTKSMYMKRNERSFLEKAGNRARNSVGSTRVPRVSCGVSPQASRLRCAKRRLYHLDPGFHAQVVDFQPKHRKTSDYVALFRIRNVAQSQMRDFAGSETGAPRKVVPDFHAQVVDFPYIARGKKFFEGRKIRIMIMSRMKREAI